MTKISKTHHITRVGNIKRNPMRTNIKNYLTEEQEEKIMDDWADRCEKNENIEDIQDVPIWYILSWLDAENKPAFRNGKLQIY